jgi:hypothetical protein
MKSAINTLGLKNIILIHSGEKIFNLDDNKRAVTFKEMLK